MHISMRNWLVGATINSDTHPAVNAAGCIAQFNGDPVGIKTPTGILGFDLGASRRIRTMAVLDCRGTGGTFRMRVRSGGSAGAIQKTWSFGIPSYYASYYNTGPQNVYETVATDVTGDYVSIECLGRYGGSVYPASSNGYTQIGRIWVGDYLAMSFADTASMTEVDATLIEESRTGEEFFTEGRTRRDITSPTISIPDNLASGGAAGDGDYEDWQDELITGSSEVLLYAHTEFSTVVHGQLAPATLRSDAGPLYTLSPLQVGGF